MKKYPSILALLYLVFLNSCSNEQQSEPLVSEPKKVIFSNQIEALEKAKEMEQLIQNSADKQRQLIEEQIQ